MDDDTPRCFCDALADRKTCHKEGTNNGREFYTCRFRKCKFFRAVDGKDWNEKSKFPKDKHGYYHQTGVVISPTTAPASPKKRQLDPPSRSAPEPPAKGQKMETEYGTNAMFESIIKAASKSLSAAAQIELAAEKLEVAIVDFRKLFCRPSRDAESPPVPDEGEEDTPSAPRPTPETVKQAETKK